MIVQKIKFILFLGAFCSLLGTSVDSSKILAVFPFGIHSYFTLGFKLVKELTDRGHEVTFINAYPQEKPIKNLKEVSVAELAEKSQEFKSEFYDLASYSQLGELNFGFKYGCLMNEIVLNNKNVQDLLNSDEKFDLVIMAHFMNEAMFIFAHRFNCPLVLLAGLSTTSTNNYLVANPSQPSYVPHFQTDYDSHMSLWQRFKNTYYDIVSELFIHFVLLKRYDEILKTAIPNAPNLQDIIYNSSLMLLSSHISLKDPAPLQPNIKEIGGYHVGPLKPLPKDLQEFLDNAKEGVIIFSMGSNLKSSAFPNETKEVILKAFSKIKQKVLWKFETDLPNKPKNVKIVSWLPQQDVLAHSNVILLITHGGLLSTIEAVYYAVPILGLPVFWDQKRNVQNMVKKEMGLKIPSLQIDNENFDRSLRELINNPKYRENAKKYSNIMHDQPVKQIDEAMFWIEYVIRHKGAPHLKSAALNLKWYQRYLIDIAIILGVILLVISIVLYYGFRRMFNKEITKLDKTKKNK